MFHTPKNDYVNSRSSPTEKWKVYKGYKRDKYNYKGVVLSKNVHKYLEIYDRDRRIPAYTNASFDDWQARLSKHIHDGYNCIVDVETSCGKTWAVNQIVSYEILTRETDTALIVIPNQSILLDTVDDIGTNHTKKYKHGRRMLDFSTGKWTSMEEGSMNAQIVCLTADIVLYYLENRYETFFKNIKYIVFDEVHMPEISAMLWKLSLLPFKCQYILLSATLGDTELICDELRKYRSDRSIRVVKYGIRPIPLQRVLFKRGIEMSKKGLILEKSELDTPTAFTLQINTEDPTPRDIKKMSISLGEKIHIPKERDEQFYLGMKVASDFTSNTGVYDSYIAEEQAQIKCAVDTPEPKVLLSLLQNLFARGMGPVLIFHPNPLECVKIVKQMTAILSNIEDGDEEVRENVKLIRRMEKKAKRKRDKMKWKQEAKNFNEAKEREGDVTKIPEYINKWRFPYNDEYKLRGRHIPEYITGALEYGIGIHIESMKHSLRRQMFNMYRKRAIVVMVADIGLSVGVNLPARTVILTGNITPTMYRQMGGRAGRRGLDNQGYIIPIVSNTYELLHSEKEERHIDTIKPFSFIDTISFNRSGYDSLKYTMLTNWVGQLDSHGENLYLEKYRWLKRTGLIDCKWTDILLELDVDRVIYFIFLLNKGYVHYYCSTSDVQQRLDNLLLLLAYLLDPGLHEAVSGDTLPDLPELIVTALEPLEKPLSPENRLLVLDGSVKYSNYIYDFYKNDVTTDIKRIASFQLKLYQLVKIVKSIVVGKYYRVEEPDLFWETLSKLDEIMWSKCYKMRGATSGLY